MNNYFRITVYSEEHNISAIFDSNGRYEKLWMFTSFFVKNNWKLLALAKDGEFEDGNLPRLKEDTEHIFLRACMKGKVENVNGKICILGKEYKSDR